LIGYEEFFYNDGGDILKQVAQRSCGCPIIESVQGQIGWGFEQPESERCPCPWQGALNFIIFKGLFQPRLFCDSMSTLWQMRNKHFICLDGINRSYNLCFLRICFCEISFSWRAQMECAASLLKGVSMCSLLLLALW